MNETSDKNNESALLSEFMCFALYSANHAMHRLNKPALDELGLTYPQFLVLVTLWESDDQLVSEIGEKLFLESNTLTPLLKRLESAGHIKRKRDDNDERKVRVTLTNSGKRLKKRTTSFNKLVRKAAKLNPDSFDKLQEEITLLRENLKESSKSQKQQK